MNINDFKNHLKGGGIRTNLFRVNGAIGPSGFNNSVPFLVRTSSLPASTISTINVPFRGRQLKFPGNRTFDTWNITIISDSDMTLRTQFEKWMEAINTTIGNVAELPHDLTQGSTLAQGLFPTWTVDLLDRQNHPKKTYAFFHCFPSSIGEVALDSDGGESLGEFSVTLEYSYFLTSNAPNADLTESVDLGGVGGS